MDAVTPDRRLFLCALEQDRPDGWDALVPPLDESFRHGTTIDESTRTEIPSSSPITTSRPTPTKRRLLPLVSLALTPSANLTPKANIHSPQARRPRTLRLRRPKIPQRLLPNPLQQQHPLHLELRLQPHLHQHLQLPRPLRPLHIFPTPTTTLQILG